MLNCSRDSANTIVFMPVTLKVKSNDEYATGAVGKVLTLRVLIIQQRQNCHKKQKPNVTVRVTK